MLALIVGAIASIAGILVGYWLRAFAARSELAAVKSELAQARAESAARAGFEALAVEREKAIAQLTADSAQLRMEINKKSDEASGAAKTIAELNTLLESERKNLTEKLQLLDTAKEALSNQFQAVAAKILEEKTKSFAEGSQKELGTLLAPLKTQIKEFRERVEQAQKDSNTGVATLQGLIGGLSNLNQQLAEQAKNLTTALRGSAKAQGDWGEFILRDLLEKAGLREGEQYSFQQSFAGVEAEDGERLKNVRTDVIVKLPGERCLIIDSKVSLTAYTDYANAQTDADRAAALKLHLASVRSHVTGLGKAGYHRLPGVETPDFVVMFVPVEPAFLAALQNDPALWADAYQQGILLVGPTTLLYIIRIVNVLWQQEQQSRNVRDVMDRGSELYDKFVNFVSDLEAVGKSLRAADQSYGAAMKKLSEGRGNLIRQVEMLRELGVKSSKSLPAKMLETAGVDEEAFALAAEAEENEMA